MSISEEDYRKYRGKCKEMCEELMAKDDTLTLVKGWYYEPFWSREEQHWWIKDKNGEIIDPTRRQFPSGGIKEFYREYAGVIECEQCGKAIEEDNPTHQENVVNEGRFSFCSGHCACVCFGVA